MLNASKFWSAVRERPAWLLLPLFESGALRWLPGEQYLKLQYWAFTGQWLHLNPPMSFNEKISWLKLHDHRDIYRTLADKYDARDFVRHHLGDSWLVPLLGVWPDADQVDFDVLPGSFVLKCTHGYGGTVLCRNKSSLDIPAVRAQLKKVLKTDFYSRGREWAYYRPHPRVIAEALVDDGGGLRPADYKFMCFNGRVRFLCLSRALGDFDRGSVSFFYPDGTPAPFKRADYPRCPPSQPLPRQLEQMKAAAEQLAGAMDVPFVRVDFYEADGHVYFSEFTFYPCGGSIFFDPPEYNQALGNLLVL